MTASSPSSPVETIPASPSTTVVVNQSHHDDAATASSLTVRTSQDQEFTSDSAIRTRRPRPVRPNRPSTTRSGEPSSAAPNNAATNNLLPRLPPPLIPLPAAVTNDLVDLGDDFLGVGSSARSNLVKRDSSKKKTKEECECAICLEKEPDSALIPCGHMCMCYECAVTVQKLRSSLCPICRQPILDILRIYRT